MTSWNREKIIFSFSSIFVFTRPIYHDWHVVMIPSDQNSPTHEKEELKRLQTYCRQSLSVQESKTRLPKLRFPCHCLAAICMPFEYLLGINPLQTEKNPDEIFLCPGAHSHIGRLCGN